jgi:hypothetical protein
MKPTDEAQSGIDIIDSLRNGGFTAMMIGAAGMVARILLSGDEGMTIGKAIRHVLAAGITAYLVGQGLDSTTMANGLKMACLGVSGAAATEIVEYAVRWVKAKGAAEVAKVSKKGAVRGKKK